MWNQVFPSLWDSLNESEQTKLVNPLSRLLSQSYHRYQLQLPAGHGYNRNVVQTLLHAISKCKVGPLIPVELIKYIGKTFNAWHASIDILERRLFSIKDSTRTEDINSITNSLHLLYEGISDHESQNGLRRMTATTSQTLITLDLLAMKQWSQAQERIVTSISSNTITPSNGLESYQWERDWITCAKELGQWDVLKEYGQSRDDPNTLLDAAWKIPDWSIVKTVFNMPAVVALAECQLPDTKLMLYQIYAAINEGRTSEVVTLCRQASQLILQKWQVCNFIKVVLIVCCFGLNIND
jgi:transformation/transcription domain-associated protein